MAMQHLTAPADAPISGGIDLELYRLREGLSYDALAQLIGVGAASTALRYAIGARWPDADLVDRIEERTVGAVTLYAMHRRRAAWLRQHPRPRVQAVDHAAE